EEPDLVLVGESDPRAESASKPYGVKLCARTRLSLG
ncbi:unnamed protein product, partial [marine sediment metagenome]